MITPDHSDSDAVLHYLGEPIFALWTALDDGISFADSTMAVLRPDKLLWAHLARHRAGTLLGQSRDPSWKYRGIKHSGIEITKGPFTVRTFKTQDDGPPSPGPNRARRKFFTQDPQFAFAFWDPTTTEPILSTNLIIDWGVSEDREVILHLSMPIGIWDYKASPILQWRKPVTIDESGTPGFASADEDVDVELDIDEDETGEGEVG